MFRTFLNGLIHVGMRHYSGGRIEEQASVDLDASLRSLGFELLRFKRGRARAWIRKR
jgi:tRNA uridine 5-carboxymethylaminomethyl modification enzyme